jgi:hypothetical protein
MRDWGRQVSFRQGEEGANNLDIYPFGEGVGIKRGGIYRPIRLVF